MSVYFAQHRRGKLIKIGWSANVPNRMSALNTKLIGAVRGGKKEEAAHHRRFAHLRVQGEWFRASEDLLAYIRNEAQKHKPDYGNVQTAIRLNNDLLVRADKLAEQMSQPHMRPITRSDVLRAATAIGLDILEAEIEAERKKR